MGSTRLPDQGGARGCACAAADASRRAVDGDKSTKDWIAAKIKQMRAAGEIPPGITKTKLAQELLEGGWKRRSESAW